MIAASDFIAAIQSGEVAEVRRRLSADPTLASSIDDNGVSVITHAFYCRQNEIADLLVHAKIDLDIFKPRNPGETPSALRLGRRAAARAHLAEPHCEYSYDRA